MEREVVENICMSTIYVKMGNKVIDLNGEKVLVGGKENTKIHT